MCKFCGDKNDCFEKLKTHFGLKCQICGTIGFIEKNELNIQRLEFFIDDFRTNLNLHEVCIIPMNGCPNCVKEENVN